ncbi:aquaporin-like protein [Cristinia sonorae]|uniref:Aquaporin-like protein n=1 Tax=Cristinia sonorae TaxID=1940300 RepID=A0A8K0XUX1_9AGAR|nr:aquaporin-like protein [Cristinia sonorae]
MSIDTVQPISHSSKFVHLGDVAPRPAPFQAWERFRRRQAHWAVEMIAEGLGVFFYVFAGVGPTAGFVLGSIAGEELSSVFQIGLSYAIGIVLALVVCSATSGGHFNPAITIAFTITKGFPKLKAVRYILAQLIGGYIACMLVYVQYKNLIDQVIAALKASGKYDAIMFTPQGPGGIFGLYLLPHSNLGQVFLNEFLCTFIIGVVIWAVLDPTNIMVSPIAGPWIVALTYATVIWGYSPVGLAANAARDLPGRLAALTIWGRAASGGTYAAIAALTNIPATLLGALFYEFILADPSRVITATNLEVIASHKATEEHSQGLMGMRHSNPSSVSSADEKTREDVSERA